ncbi:hypothetical protein BhenCHDE101_07850 [Bartonella henselae]|nr:hypothetical protein BhenCHDE101_07850 [Bartonella henselae]
MFAYLYHHKCIESEAQWLYRYTIHGLPHKRHRERSLRILRNVLLKQARECATQVYFVWSVLFCMKA